MFTKPEFKLEMFVGDSGVRVSDVCLLLGSTVQMVDHSVLKVWILSMPYQ